MKSMINKAEVDGYVFSQELKLRVTGENSKNPGTPFINGTINVAIDEDCVTVVPVRFSYVTEFFKSGKTNDTYTLLKELMDTNKTVSNPMYGKEKAMKIRIQGNVDVNDFVSSRDEQMVSAKQISGSFAHLMTSGEGQATFEVDMLIKNYAEREVEDGEDYGVISGYVFNYRNDFMPVDFNVRKASGGMTYFDNCDISNQNLLLTKVWGNIVSNVVERKVEAETAFGAPAVSSTPMTIRSWDIAGASGEPYEFGDDDVMTKADIKSGMQTREEHLADVRKRYEDYKNSTSGNGFAAPGSAVSADDDDDFDF